jgi:phage-related protein
LFEIRIEHGGHAHRIFCCFDGGSLVVLFNAFEKKTQKTPVREIATAMRLMKEYFDSKR